MTANASRKPRRGVEAGADQRPSDLFVHDLFPAPDPVGHFVIALGVASNDLVRARQGLLTSNGYTQLSELRQLLRHLWETQLLVQGSVQDEVVSAFVDRVAVAYPNESLSGTDLVALLRGTQGVREPKLRNVLHMARDWSDHYPLPNDPALIETLRSLASQSVHLGPEPGDDSGRAAFADEVMARMAFPFPETVAEERLTQLLAGANDAASLVILFARTALATWMAEQPPALRRN